MHIRRPVIVETTTDNRNRAVSEIRFAFSKNGGNLGLHTIRASYRNFSSPPRGGSSAATDSRGMQPPEQSPPLLPADFVI